MAHKTIKGEDFKKEFKRPKPGAYLFYGEENFLKLRELQSVRGKICTDENFEVFNHFVFTRDNYSADALMSAVVTIPMMSDYKLIELYELPFSEYRKKDDMDGLASALAAASESEDTVLIIYTTPENFDAGEGKTPSALFKMISEYALPVEFAHESTSRIISWVQRHFTSDKIVAEIPECNYLIDTVGHDMTTLEGEINKLCAYLHYKERDRLQKTDVDLICSHNKEIGAFEFADSILDGNSEKSFYILADMRLRGEAAPVILGGITKVYSDMYSLRLFSDAGVTPDEAAKKLGIHPYVAKVRMAKAKACERAALEAVIGLCADTDAQLKSSAIDDYILLERLIVSASQYRRKKVF